MPRNGSGTYSLPSGNPVVTGTTISSSGWANPTLSDIASALTSSIAVDGQTTPTANLPMGNFRHTGCADAQNANEYATVSQVQAAGLAVLGASKGNTLTLTGAASVYRAVYMQTSGSNRWFAGADTATESGSNAGSNFEIIRYTDAGAIIDSPMTINRATGNVTFSQNVTATGTLSGSNLTGTSDERLKEDWRPMAHDFLERMAGVLHGTFAWVNGGPRSAGAGAQSMREAFPEVVHEAEDGTLSIAYGHAALVTVLELIPLVLRLLDEHGEAP